jgi:hypothetical protein
MALDVYGTEFLIGAFGVVDVPNPFFLDLFFPSEQTFETEKIAFDKVDRARRLAPFVSYHVAGKPMRTQGFQTKDFQPAYLKPKHVVDSTRPLKRMPGERLLGAMSPEERYIRVLAELMKLQEDYIRRREEWMAAQIMLSGQVIVEGEDFPAMVVNFGRPSTHTIQLTGANQWGQTGVSSMSNLRTWNALAMLDSGFNANVVIMDPAAQELFIKDPEVKEILNNRANTPSPNFKIGNIQLGGVLAGAIGEEVKYLGYIGEFHVFVYQQTYVDEAGNVQQMIPPNTVILSSPPGVQGVRTYGAIRDAEAGFRPLPRFPSMWRSRDPSLTYLMTQSAPLPIVGWPEASVAVTVAG